VLLSPGRRPDPDLGRLLADLGLPPLFRSPADLDALAHGGNHQGIVLVVGEYRYATLEALVATAPRDRPLLALDQVQDPHNLGAILRSAAVLGAVGVILPERRAASVTAAVVRTSAGATERLPVARVVNLGRALGALKDAGYWLFGAAGEGGQAPERLPLTGSVVLVLGSEGGGLRRSILQACDHLVTIPMENPLSLNVSVAAGVLLAEAARQRRALGSPKP
jgi:23S rRNA (guanosine2251-2'-O)-methyltransferase